MNLGFGIADELARTFFDFATDIPSRAGYAVLIHGDAPPDDRSCDRLRSAVDVVSAGKVPDELLMSGFLAAALQENLGFLVEAFRGRRSAFTSELRCEKGK